ncbi:MAG: hypothetical protein EXS12_01475 [Phycisphaerales bacterium]|nr:hypothetical protein [Phycisphaerales bacterium]
MVLRAVHVLSLTMVLASCVATPSPKTLRAVDGRMPQLVGRWIFSPGDSSLPQDPKAATADSVIESPIGASISLGEGGIMTARIAQFVRRGTWKISSGSLKIILDPPPERVELSFIPIVEQDRLALRGSDGIIFVYHRDLFVSLPNQISSVPQSDPVQNTKK